MTQDEKAKNFAALHRPGDPVILYNVWDVGSARAVATAGAKAIATASHAVAAANGFDDGEAIPLGDAIANLARIVAAAELPVTLDLESGYGRTPDAVGDALTAALDAGAVGCNLEDQIIGRKGLYDIDDQAARLEAAREAASRGGVDAFINARTDVFLKVGREAHDEAMLDAALERGRAYAAAGASGLFVPGLGDEALIGRLCRESPFPVNIFKREGGPGVRRLAELGVARISYGPGPHRATMAALEGAAREAFAALD